MYSIKKNSFKPFDKPSIKNDSPQNIKKSNAGKNQESKESSDS